MQTTHKIPKLSQPKQVLFSKLLQPLCSADDPGYDGQVLLLAQQVKEAAQEVIDELTKEDKEIVVDASKPTVVGVLTSDVDRRFLVFTSTKEEALKTASKPLTLKVEDNHNQLVRSWHWFIAEKASGVPCKHYIPVDQRAMYEAIYSSGKAPKIEVVERGNMTRVDRAKARQRYADKMRGMGYTLGSESWN